MALLYFYSCAILFLAFHFGVTHKVNHALWSLTRNNPTLDKYLDDLFGRIGECKINTGQAGSLAWIDDKGPDFCDHNGKAAFVGSPGDHYITIGYLKPQYMDLKSDGYACELKDVRFTGLYRFRLNFQNRATLDVKVSERGKPKITVTPDPYYL